MRRMIEEPNAFPLFLNLTEVFRLVQKSLHPLAGIGGVGIDKAACAAEGQKASKAKKDSRHGPHSAQAGQFGCDCMNSTPTLQNLSAKAKE